MHSNHKKKTRARNRPRNKCNRTDENGLDEGAKVTESEEQPPQERLEDNPPKAMPDSNAISLIQKVLRQKLLAKNRVTPPVVTATPAIPQTPPVVQTPVPVPKLGSKSVKVNNLLKCIGSELQKGSVESAKGALLSQLGEMFSTDPLSDAESSDEEAEYVEYIYKPRPYFMASLCNHCKSDLCGKHPCPCKGCSLVYYCSVLHMQQDQAHRQLCYGLRQLVDQQGHDIFYKCGDFSADQFRSYRIVCIRQVEQLINRSLTATEQEVLLFPYICSEAKCREHKLRRLSACTSCGELAFCKDKPEHLSSYHADWCTSYRLFKAFVIFQAKFGRLEPPLPDKVLRESPVWCSNTRQILKQLNFTVNDQCEYAALTQISTGPLTAFLALKLSGRLAATELTIHLIGAEMEFEVDVFQKWEIFLLHLLPTLTKLKVVFVGPELNPNNISFDQLSRIRCCRLCRKAERTVQYFFESRLYHEYCSKSDFIKPDLVCFFNSGLYRATGYALEDTWPGTIKASLSLKCPIVVTSYTKYEAPLDLSHFLNQSNRHLTVVLPPTTNPFGSEKPERNFISDDDAPFMFKNYQCFVVE